MVSKINPPLLAVTWPGDSSLSYMGRLLIKICPPVSTPPNTNNFGGVVLAALSFVLTLSLSPQAVQGAVAMQQAQASSSGGGGAAAHNKLIDIDFERVSLDKALDIIAQKAGVSVSYRRDQVVGVKPVTLHANRITAGEAFARVLAGTSYQLQASGAQLYLVERKQTRSAAQGSISGKVTDGKSGKGVAGAKLSIDAGEISVISGDDGVYRLTGVSVGAHTVVVRLLGYAKQTREVIVGEGTVTIDFKLEPSANVLSDVIVTGTIIGTELKAVPNAITVVTAKDIEQRGITRIDQLFRGEIPGLVALERGTDAALDEVTMYSRGATKISTITNEAGATGITNPIKTYVDGVELAESKYLSQIDPKSIERIEILTGPQASTIYGANAINGVMQIFTKRGSGIHPRVVVSAISGLVQNNLGTASAPLHSYDGNISGTEGKVSYNVGTGWNYLGAWSPGKQTQRVSTYGATKYQTGQVSFDVSARRGRTGNKVRGAITQLNTDLGADGRFVYRSGIVTPIKQTLDGKTVGISLNYMPLTWWTHQLTLGNDESNTERLGSALSFASRSDTSISNQRITSFRSLQSYSSTLSVPISVIGRASITYGADHWRNRSAMVGWDVISSAVASPNIIKNKPSKNSGVYIQSQLGLWDALFLTYGVRTDWNPNFGDRARVRPGRYGIAYSRQLGSISAKLRGSYGRSIRPPDSGLIQGVASTVAINKEVFGNYYTTLPNPELGPEFQQGGEGGIELYLGNVGSLIITRYNQTVDGLIQNVFPADSVRALQPGFNALCDASFECLRADGYFYLPQDQNLNVGSIRNQGWELQGTMNMGALTTRGIYSWTKSRVIGITPKYRALLINRAFIPGSSFNFIPEHTWSISGSYARRNTSISLYVNGVGTTLRSENGELGLTTSPSLRLRVREAYRYSNELTPSGIQTGLPGIYRQMSPGYALADVNFVQHFTPLVEAMLQISNLGNFYRNDVSVLNPTIGRQTRAGLRLRFN